jgi:hypothetical protein
LISNYFRYQKGYYYSCSKKQFISLNNKNEKKIYKQYHKFIYIKSEFQIFLQQFFENWIQVVMNRHHLISKYKKLICFCGQNTTEHTLLDRVNSDFRFLSFKMKLKNIKTNYFKTENENYFNYKTLLKFEIEVDDLFPIFYYFLNKQYPDMTDLNGIALENYYVPIPMNTII